MFAANGETAVMTSQTLSKQSSYTTHHHLRAWRHAFALTQEQLGNRIGSKVSTISGWENGTRRLDLADLERIAEAYGVHPALLLFAPAGSQHFEALQAVNNLWEQMDPETFRDWLAAGRRMVPPTKP